MGASRIAGAEPDLLPAHRPARIHWSTLVLLAGMVICAFGLVATIAGVPGSMGYDIDGAPDRNKPDSHDPLKVSQSIDGNMKWIAENSGDAPTSYVGYIKRINASEAAIGPMVAAVMSMDASVNAIGVQIGGVQATTVQMRKDMEAMATVSAASAATMTALGEDIGFLSKSMLGLADATQQLTTKMGRIEKQAGSIAKNGTSQALVTSRDLNQTLPDGIPPPVMEGATNAAVGGGVDPVENHVGMPPQPPRPNAWETGAVL